MTREREAVFDYYLRLIARTYPSFQTVLDLGCAFGLFARVCKERGLNAYGLDISRYALRAGRGNLAGKSVRASLAQIPFREASFDVLVAMEVLEHLSEDREPPIEALGVLRLGGDILCDDAEWRCENLETGSI